MKKPFLNIDEITEFEQSSNGKYEEKYAPISPLIGAEKLGYSLSIVPPGKRVCPFHNHQVNEEMFLILEGEGTLRFGNKEYQIKKHDIIACPPGGKEVAHQIINTSNSDLKYLCLSTNKPVEICEYPDSNKVLAMVGEQGNRKFRYMVKADQDVDYLDGELE
ncbi:cupin domain-containing protein [Bacteriovoracaceae bacterium]|nr:cupin domain-containing protein [Bacteriovoracaceae bacterium]